MKEGDYITCKKNYYKHNGDDFKTEYNNLFKSPIFKRNQKYKISNIIIFNNCEWKLNVNYYYINNIRFNKNDFNEYFYTLKEERKIKLNKIKYES